MDIILEVFKAYLIPGSLTFLALGVIVGSVLLHASKSTRRWGSGILGFLAVLYLILSIPAVARSYERLLSEGSEAIRSRSDAAGAEAIVVLGGGSATYRARGMEINELSDASSLRVLEGARLYHMLDELPVVVSGGASELVGVFTPESVPMQQELVAAGVPTEMILLESRSGSTREQAENLAVLLEARELDRFILVTSPIHMRRSLATMRSEGLDPIPSPSSQHSDDHPVIRGGILPNPAALDASRVALREAIALFYYWVQGWIELP
jgi:uncharacterized SAM-binding protein YcdF (DUF218 family)